MTTGLMVMASLKDIPFIIDGGPYAADDDNPLLSYIENIGHLGRCGGSPLATHPHNELTDQLVAKPIRHVSVVGFR